MATRRIREITLDPQQTSRTVQARATRIEVRSEGSPVPTGAAHPGDSPPGKNPLLRGPREEMSSNRDDARAIGPILCIKVAPSPSASLLAESILKALGDSKLQKGASNKKSDHLHEQMRRSGVQMLMLDEAMHTLEGIRPNSMSRFSAHGAMPGTPSRAKRCPGIAGQFKSARHTR